MPKSRRIEVITSKENESIKRLKKLHEKKYREELKAFLIEGVKVVNEALDNVSETINLVVFSQEAIQKYGEFFDKCINLLNSGKLRRLVQVPEKIFEHISTTTTPQGVLAECSFFDKGLDVLNHHNRVVVIDCVQDPGNLGTIIRCADAFGFECIVTLDGTVDVYNPKVVRSAMGSIFHIDIVRETKKEELLETLREKRFALYVTTPHGNVDISTLSVDNRFAIVIGSESRGIDAAFLENATKKVKISMPGKAESLNAAVAAAIVLYELRKK
ncbi:TrmH family RNA methyltransferase [Caldicellulosiruptor naganoensis]|uniref:RNA methyltransferase n=1 Tax=Caldicellulosiruptor naganoensis TaxID=29324 RepID=A0ABY7BD68_9FIRM|nr:RNA methyltransferase [Caldicellulosiruptor naganoensis]WAM30753.1 RNA methyltransferase [Caldicellulosiruptor naganoensis]